MFGSETRRLYPQILLVSSLLFPLYSANGRGSEAPNLLEDDLLSTFFSLRRCRSTSSTRLASFSFALGPLLVFLALARRSVAARSSTPWAFLPSRCSSCRRWTSEHLQRQPSFVSSLPCACSLRSSGWSRSRGAVGSLSIGLQLCRSVPGALYIKDYAKLCSRLMLPPPYMPSFVTTFILDTEFAPMKSPHLCFSSTCIRPARLKLLQPTAFNSRFLSALCIVLARG
ncbi:hypothetical protein B0H12DRAFT_512871 [Mycena haematopus]|nr:hypothetical protein B0H12DRAFT_512871 [Mycena haematopus]